MAIQFRRGTDAAWEQNKNKIAEGEPAIAVDTGRVFVGIGSGSAVELSVLSKDDYIGLAYMLADDYAEKTYFAGEFVKYAGNIYEANQDIDTAEPFDVVHWTLIASYGEV